MYSEGEPVTQRVESSQRIAKDGHRKALRRIGAEPVGDREIDLEIGIDERRSALPCVENTGSVIVDANELVQLAARAERAHRMPHTDGARFRFTPDAVGEPFGTVKELRSNTAPDAAPSGVPPEFTRVLASYHFEWGQPLSVERFAAWRASHACSRQDRVVHRASDGLLVLSTTVLDGELREVELTKDAETYRVVGQTLTFQGVGRLEIEALAQGAPSYTPTRTSPSPAVAVASRRPNRDELDRAELRARLVLGQTRLDMRGDVRVSRTPEAVRVEGTLASSGQHRSAGKQLAAIKHVQVDLHVGNLPNTAAGQGLVRAVTAKPGLGRWVNRTFDDPAARGSFVTDLTGSIGTVRQRLALLSALRKRYPNAPGQLSPAGLALFQQLVNLHYGNLRAEMDELRMRVSALAGTVPVARAAPDPPSDLTACAATALPRATALEREVQALLTHKNLTATEQHRVVAAFEALWESVHGPRGR